MARARRNPPSRDALVAALRRARAVLVLTERMYDLGHSVAELRREGYRAMAQEQSEESYAITKAAQRSVREIGDLLGRTDASPAEQGPEYASIWERMAPLWTEANRRRVIRAVAHAVLGR